jgi:hypothetical protein
MTSIAFKLICTLSGLFGAFILLFALVAYFQGLLAPLDSGTIALKIGGTIVRAAFLLLCAWAAWRSPHQAAWFAWGAFFVFVLSGAADEVYRLGLVEGFGNLMPTYYQVAVVHALVAIAAWLLTPKATVVAAVG